MARPMMPNQQKLAEKLTILNDRGAGMLIRIYNIKKMLGNPESKPPFFSEKSLEPVVKSIVRKFPTIDTRSNTTQVQTLSNIRGEITKSLSLYYYTFVDILDFKDHVTDLLTTMDAAQITLDIVINYDLTRMYLDLVVTYVSIMVLLSKIDDRKAVLGLFNAAYELQHGRAEESFPRLGQMILDYDTPMKKLSEEFVPHSKCLGTALMSLEPVYATKIGTAEKWRGDQKFSLLADSQNIVKVLQTDMMMCEYLSIDTIERWIIFGHMLCHAQLQQPRNFELWKQALISGYVIQLCRDEVLLIHPFIIGFFESMKGSSKRVSEVREFQHTATQLTPQIHREKRKFLRTALKELALVFTDQPGLLGPKILYLLCALMMARDEVSWLLRHVENTTHRKGQSRMEDFVDRQIAELLFHMQELKDLVKKYSQVLQRYYIQFLSGYDASLLNQLIQKLAVCPEDESVILSSFYSTIAGLSVRKVEDNELFDFRGLRLDWFRLQAYTSVGRSGLCLAEHRDLARHMNNVVFHTKMIDSLHEVLSECSDLSIYCFYITLLEQQFKQCIEFPAQHRYSIAFPMVCADFMTATHELCPEETHSIGTTSIQYTHWFLKEISEEVNQVITAICEQQCYLADKLLPKQCAALLAVNQNKKKGKDKKKNLPEPEKPGEESRRRHREDFTRMDKLHMALTELCYAINYCGIITVYEHGFVPREFFTQHLEARFNKALVGMAMYNPETKEIAKPSEMLNSIRAVMSVLQSLENYVHVDISRVFNNVLPQQTQPLDSFNGEKTITAIYTDWYLEVLLRRVTVDQIVFSPVHKAFMNLTVDGQVPFQAEEYADLMELRALAELIGPYGMKYLGEKLVWHVASQVDELKKLVVRNKATLLALRSNFDKPEEMKELQKRLQEVDNLLQRMTIVGFLLSFRALAQEALHDALELRIPFLLSSIKDFQEHSPQGQESMIVNEMASAAGLPCDIDPALCAALRNSKGEVAVEDEYLITCLLMVFIAVSIPRLARGEFKSSYKPSFEGHLNNAHCLAKAINSLAGAMFTLCGRGDVELRLKEFLALASSSLLRLGQETDKEAVRNRESVYLLLDQIVQESPFLTMDLLETCFPYALLRTSFNQVCRSSDVY